MIQTVVLRCIRTNSCGRLLLISKRQFNSGRQINNNLESSQPSSAYLFVNPGTCGDNTVNVRKAALSDYENVISILQNQKIYDRLPDRYCSQISCKTNTGYVANINGLDVGFQLTHLIDDGKTLVLDELRVNKKTERKEVQKAVLKYINEISDPNIRFSATGVDVVLMTNQEMGFYGTDQWNLITKRVKETFNTNMTNLLVCLRSSGIRLKTATRLHNHDVMKMICSPRQSQNIFKDQRLMKSEIPYRPMASNIPLVMDKRTLSIGSNIKDDKYALLSFGTYSHTAEGLHCHLNFHGNIDESVEEHLFIHMMSLLNRSNLNIMLEICADVEKDLCLIRDIMKRFCFESNSPNSTSNIISYYERSMN